MAYLQVKKFNINDEATHESSINRPDKVILCPKQPFINRRNNKLAGRTSNGDTKYETSNGWVVLRNFRRFWKEMNGEEPIPYY